MKLFGRSCFLFCLLASPLFGADAGVSVDSTAEAMPVLQAGYVDFAALQSKPGDRLDDIIARAQGGVSIVPAAKADSPPPIIAALLPDNIIYCRLASFNPGSSWGDLAGRIDKWIGEGAEGVILDVRSNVAPDDFDGAAQLAGLFTAAGTPLFSVTDAKQNSRPYTSIAPGPPAGPLPVTAPLVILTDARTMGAAEAFAEALRNHGALVMGGATGGRGAVFAEHTLASGQVLRYVAGRVVMADGTQLWNNPVVPDIGIAADDKKEQAALALIGQEHVADVIGEAAERHRMSEAALVHGEDPEIEASLLLRDPKTAAAPSAVAAQDVVLVDALDSLKAIRLSQRADAPAAPETPSTAR